METGIKNNDDPVEKLEGEIKDINIKVVVNESESKAKA